MPDLNIETLEALEQAATPGPWKFWDSHINEIEPEIAGPDRTVIMRSRINEDADFIAALRNAAPALIAAAKEADELRADRDAANEIFNAQSATIANLRSLLAKAGETLEPFARASKDSGHGCSDRDLVVSLHFGETGSKQGWRDIIWGDLRAARSVRDEIKDALSPIAAVQKEGT